MVQEKTDLPTIDTSEEGSDINERMSLLELYLTELDHLSGADSPERKEIYEKAARLGTKLIEGQF